MEKRTQCAAAALAALLAACAVPDVPEYRCGSHIVTVTHAPGYLAAHPEHLRVCDGDTVVFQFAPSVDRDAARTRPGKGQPSWLGSDKETRGDVKILVPLETPYGTYKYEIVVDGIGTLDPRLTVSRH